MIILSRKYDVFPEHYSLSLDINSIQVWRNSEGERNISLVLSKMLIFKWVFIFGK